MNTRRFVLSCLALFIGFAQHLMAANAPTKPGYNILVEVSFDEKGVSEEAKIVESDDLSGDHFLEQIALNLCRELKQTPELKDGQPVKFKRRVPFNFPVEDDEGPAANDGPKPALNSQQNNLRPIFPESLVAKGESGGAILELQIGSFGNVQNVKVLRASHQAYADSAVEALKSWVFVPARKEGVNIESRWRIAIGFSADGKEIDWKWRVAPRPSLGGYVVVHAVAPAAEPTAPAATSPAAPTK